MINFDKRGNLKPYEPIKCTLAELERSFVSSINSATRRSNFTNFVRYSEDLKKILEVKFIRQWINGSFVTRKVNPKDIDLITFVDYKLIKKLGSKLDEFRPPGSWSKYSVDAYLIAVYLEVSDDYKFTKLDTAYWLNQFNSTRPNRNGAKFNKGFLEIIY